MVLMHLWKTPLQPAKAYKSAKQLFHFVPQLAPVFRTVGDPKLPLFFLSLRFRLSARFLDRKGAIDGALFGSLCSICSLPASDFGTRPSATLASFDTGAKTSKENI
jgi:hypothetical protein